MGLRKHVLDRVEIAAMEEAILGVVRPTKNIGSLCCGVCSKRDNSILDNSTTADCNAADETHTTHTALAKSDSR